MAPSVPAAVDGPNHHSNNAAVSRGMLASNHTPSPSFPVASSPVQSARSFGLDRWLEQSELGHAAPPSLLHAWPPLESHYVECTRKLNLLRAGIRDTEGEISAASAANAFRKYGRLVGSKAERRMGGRGLRLKYSQLEAAWRVLRENNENYAALTFRYAVVSRPTAAVASASGGSGPADDDAPLPDTRAESNALLVGAIRSDTDQMLCLLRCLDRDCDGLISEVDFCHRVVHGMEAFTDDMPTTLDARWQRAALALERAPRRAGERGRAPGAAPKGKG
jgi:hypothetical protein